MTGSWGALLRSLWPGHASDVVGLRVVGTRWLTPHMRRMTFAADGLDRFATDRHLHVRLLLPPEGAARDRWLGIRRDGSVSRMDGGRQPVARKYTLRSVDARGGRVEIDFVVHGDGGPGSAWAAAARIGDVVGIKGPGGRSIEPADWYLLAGDATALPAIGRILEMLPDAARGVALIEVGGAEEELALRAPQHMRLQWLHRGPAAPGTTTLLADAVAAVSWPADATVFAWVAAEFEASQAIRSHLRSARRLERSRHLVTAYWRRDGRHDGGAHADA